MPKHRKKKPASKRRPKPEYPKKKKGKKAKVEFRSVVRRKKAAGLSAAARKGWETRRKKERERVAAERKRARVRAEKARAEEIKKAARSAAAKKGWETRRKKSVEPNLICRVLYDAEESLDEHFWSNIRYLIGDSVGNILSRIPATEGVATVWLRQVSPDEYSYLLKGEVDSSELGEIVTEEFETDIDVDSFWSTFFDHARALLPKTPDGKSGGSLLVVKMQVCYEAGKVSSD